MKRSPRTRLDVFLLGRLRVERDGRPLPGLGCGKARELLAFLLLHRDRAHRREALADRLWGEEGASEPRKALRQALWHLSSAVGEEQLLVESDGDWIRVARAASLRLDLAEFEAAWLQLEGAPGEALAPPDCARARHALELYRGELLEGSDWPWCQAERSRLRDLYLALADRVMTFCLAAEPAAGIRLGYDVLRHDPAREKTHRQLMRLHAHAGDRGAALRQYERCVAALADELGLEPSRATRQLYAQVRDDCLAGDTAAGPTRPAAPPEDVLDRLRELRLLLSEARREVHVEIEALERTLAAPAAR